MGMSMSPESHPSPALQASGVATRSDAQTRTAEPVQVKWHSTRSIEPDKSDQSAYVESFTGRFPDSTSGNHCMPPAISFSMLSSTNLPPSA
jgi:hypothetical protein